MSTLNTLEEKKNSNNSKTSDEIAKMVLDALRINEMRQGVIRAIANNLGEDVLTFLVAAISDHCEGLMECPEALGLAFGERQSTIWKAASPDA